jgi:hypothetical protein
MFLVGPILNIGVKIGVCYYMISLIKGLIFNVLLVFKFLAYQLGKYLTLILK